MSFIGVGGSNLFRTIALGILFLSAATTVIVASATEVKDGAALAPDHGVVRISVRSQLQYAAPLYVWFAKVADGKVDTDHAIPLSRTQGMPLAGSNMTDSMPRYHSLPIGHYRLTAYSMMCKQLPSPGMVCFAYGNPVPTGRYDDQSVEFDVLPHQLTDAGEFILELPPEIDLGGAVSYKQAYKQMPAASIRWRKIAAPLDQRFASMPSSPAPSVPDSLRSNITCEIKPKGMGMFYPFKC